MTFNKIMQAITLLFHKHYWEIDVTTNMCFCKKCGKILTFEDLISHSTWSRVNLISLGL